MRLERIAAFHPTRPFKLPRGNGWFGSKGVTLTVSICFLDGWRTRFRRGNLRFIEDVRLPTWTDEEKMEIIAAVMTAIDL
jgi:hypothetical protein